MFLLGERAVRVLVVGGDDSVRDDIADATADASQRFEVEYVDRTTVTDDGLSERSIDCLVVDGQGYEDGGVGIVTVARDAVPDLPVVLLVNDSDARVVRDALAAGVSDTVPRSLAAADPALLADRISAITEREHAHSAISDIDDSIAGTVSVHDPDTGRMMHVNRTLCDLLGYDRTELLARTIGDITPDISGYDHERAMQLVGSVSDSDDTIEIEWPLETADGDVRWLEAQLSEITVGGREYVLSASREVTEKRRQERQYEAIFDGVNDVITVHDPWDETLLDVNETLCEVTGYSRDALLDMGLRGISADGDQFGNDRAYDVQQRVAATGESETIDWVVETAAGDQRRLEAVVSPATIAGEDRLLVLARDVTERRQLKQTYRELFESVSDGLVVHDPDTGDVLDTNDRYCELTGYDREELVGSNMRLIVPEDPEYTYETALERIKRAREEGPQLFEFKGQQKDGGTFLGEIHLSVVDIRGEERVLASVRDVTERKRREREYEQIFNGVNDALGVFDPGTGELLQVNDTMCELTGYDRDVILDGGLDVVSAVDEGYTADRAADLLTAVMESGEPRELEWCLRTVDGEQRWLQVNATPASINGTDRLLTIGRDVTERQRSERRLRAILDRIDEAIFLTRARSITKSAQEPDYVSAGYEEIWGQSLDAIQREYEDGFFGTVHPDDEPGYRAFVESVAADIDSGTSSDRYTTEYRIQRPDDTVRWVQSDYYPVEWETGPVRIVIVSRDVTSRKERERQLVSFEEATDELATANTRREAAQTAVDAAIETLHLSPVGMFLYDEDDGVLKPDAKSAALPAELREQTVSARDGALWKAFATGETVGPSRTRTANATPGDGDNWSGVPELADWRGIPLGTHGVLFIGATDSALDRDALQSAHVLAATLEAALNHLHGKRQLATREAELRTETERADRLDRIARLTQQVEAAITEASAPSDVEHAVCKRLVDATPYDVAWIGGVEVGVDRITPTTVVGASTNYVNAMDLTTTSDPANRHPTLEAWQSERVASTNSIVGDGPTDNWREHVLSHGYQSVCAVPLTYDGTTHGVLSIAADTPNAFGERTRNVLEQLGTSIAHALAGIERRRALESDETVELEFRGTEPTLEFARLASEADCRVRHERTVQRDDDMSVYYAISDALPADVRDQATEHFTGSVDIVRDEADALLVEVRTDAWFGAPLAEYGAVLRRAEATQAETSIVVELPAGTDIRSFVDRVQDRTPSLDLAAKRHHQRSQRTIEELRNQIEATLTDRQHEALRTAFVEGYFEWPRENDGNEVAERLDITQPTFNKHLRLAERKTFAALFETGA